MLRRKLFTWSKNRTPVWLERLLKRREVAADGGFWRVDGGCLDSPYPSSCVAAVRSTARASLCAVHGQSGGIARVSRVWECSVNQLWWNVSGSRDGGYAFSVQKLEHNGETMGKRAKGPFWRKPIPFWAQCVGVPRRILVPVVSDLRRSDPQAATLFKWKQLTSGSKTGEPNFDSKKWVQCMSFKNAPIVPFLSNCLGLAAQISCFAVEICKSVSLEALELKGKALKRNNMHEDVRIIDRQTKHHLSSVIVSFAVSDSNCTPLRHPRKIYKSWAVSSQFIYNFCWHGWCVICTRLLELQSLWILTENNPVEIVFLRAIDNSMFLTSFGKHVRKSPK